MTIQPDDTRTANQEKVSNGDSPLSHYHIIDYENEDESEKEALRHALPIVIDKLQQRLDTYRQNLKSKDILRYVTDHFHCPDLGRVLAEPYRPLYASSKKYFTQTEIENFLKTKGPDEDIKKLSSDMKGLEDEWDHLLLDIDRRFVEHWNGESGRISRFSINPDAVTLIDCDTDKPTTLKSCLNPRMGRYALFEFHKRLCNVVAVCKGGKEGARKWRTRLGFDLPTLADEKGDLVHSFDFPPSVWNAAKTTKCREIAAEVGSGSMDVAIEAGSSLMAATAKTIYQTGGEIIMDGKGKVLFAHKCKTQDDRPTCSDLLGLMTKDIESIASASPRASTQLVANRKQKTSTKICTIL